jgi:flagellin-like protein
MTLNIKDLFAEEDAVSPVIGVILMVAITVILAAVIGTFVLGLGDQIKTTTPSAQVTFDFYKGESIGVAGPAAAAGYNVTVSHSGGDALENTTIEVVPQNSPPFNAEGYQGEEYTAADTIFNSTIAYDHRYTEQEDDTANTDNYDPYSLSSGDTIQLTWSPEGQSKSSVLKRQQVPSSA